MRSFKELTELISAEDSVIKEAKERKALYIKEIKGHCPVSIDDQVESQSRSNKGKNMIVDSIEFGFKWIRDDNPQFTCKGYVIRKDGSIGINRGEHYCGALSDLMGEI